MGSLLVPFVAPRIVSLSTRQTDLWVETKAVCVLSGVCKHAQVICVYMSALYACLSEGRGFISEESQRKDLYDRLQLGKAAAC